MSWLKCPRRAAWGYWHGSHATERVEEELNWIDEHIDGKPYGIDVLMPRPLDDSSDQKFTPMNCFKSMLTSFARCSTTREFRRPLRKKRMPARDCQGINFTPRESLAMLETALKHLIKAIVNALGPPPKELLERAHAKGIKVGALAGNHDIEKHKAVGCDLSLQLALRQWSHWRYILTVLWPSIVDAVALPVLGAGGVGRGRQLAAALKAWMRGRMGGITLAEDGAKRSDPRNQTQDV